MKKTSSCRVAFVLGLAMLAAASAQADRVNTFVTLGQKVTSAVAAPGDVATVGFLVTQGLGRKLTFQVARVKGSTLAPVVKLISPVGSELDIKTNGGSVVAKTTSWTAKLPDVSLTGLWRLEVRGAPGTSGGFTATIKGKDTVSLKSSKSTPPAIQVGGKNDVEIFAGDAVALTVVAGRASGNKSLVPQLAILDAYGLPLTVTPVAIANDKTGKLTLNAFRLPSFGKYTLRFTGKGNSGGAFAYAITTAPAKFKGTLPTAAAGAAFEVEPGLVATLDGTHSTPANGFRWAQVSGPTVVLSGVTTAQPTFIAPEVVAPKTVVSLAFQLTINQSGVLSKAVTVDVEIARRPVAYAGRSQAVTSAAAVTLDGTGSFDRRGSGLKYAWRQMPGDDANVTLSSAAAASPTFTAPAGNHTLHFGLTVDDGNARSFEDVVVVEAGTATQAVADAGREQYVPRMASVCLCGLASRNATGVLDGGLQWTQVSGTPVTLASATTPWASFTAPRAIADLVFELTVNGTAATADRVTVHVRPFETNVPPLARGNGPLNVPSGAVNLSGQAVDDNSSDTLRYRWGQTSGAALPLTTPDAATATATLPVGNDNYAFAVLANDGLQYGMPDVVTAHNSNYVGLPIADAGDDLTVESPTAPNPPLPVQLDGVGSSRTDGLTDPLAYEWTQISGKDWFDVSTSPVAWDPAVRRPRFVLPTDVSSLTPTRTIVLQLVVSDGTNSSLPDFVSVTFKHVPRNGRPAVSAHASDTNPIAGGTVSLLATASDHDNDPLTFAWAQTAGAKVQLTPSATSLSPSFVAPDSGTLTFQLVADDGFDKSDATDPAANVTVIVDRKPVSSIAVSPQTGSPGSFVTMDGTPSSDPESAALTYQWTQISGLPVSVNTTQPVITFTAPTGLVAFRLVVNDGRQNSDPKNASFSGNLPPTVNPTASPVDSTFGASYGSIVTLSAGPGSGGPFTFTWRQINVTGADPTISLSSTSVQNPTFTVPTPSSGTFGIAPQATFGVTASDGIQTSNESTVVVKFFASLNNNNTGGSTTKTVYSIISLNCTSCHSGSSNVCPVGSGSNATGYGMGTKTAFLNNSRGASQCVVPSSKKRLPGAGVTGQSSTSAYLLDRLQGSGGVMPPTGGLSTADKNLIQDWIDQGVQDN